MQLRTFAILWMLALAVLLLFANRRQPVTEAASVNNDDVLDLTHTIDGKAPSWDPKERFHATILDTYEQSGYFSRTLSLPEHFGTHLDAPAHFAPGAWTVEQIPPQRLIRPLAIIDVSRQARQNPDYTLSIEDIAKWEEGHGHIPAGSVVAIHSGWGERWFSREQFLNPDAKGVNHFPGFSLAAAQFLVEARAVVGLGTDTISVDPGVAADFPVHKYTAQKGVYHLESIANLEVTPETGLEVVVAPAKVGGGSGAPVRLLAIHK